MPGNDWYKMITGMGSITPCRTQCLIEESCRAFTYTKQDGGTCYLKTGFSMTGAKSVAGATTGLKDCPTFYLQIQNCDMPGNDIGSKRESHISMCAEWCGDGCRAWTWSDHNGGTRCLKSNSAPCQGDGNNKYSAVYGVKLYA